MASAPPPAAVARPEPVVSPASSKKLSAQQEAVVALNEGFREMSTLLRGMQARIDSHGDNVGQLPALGQAQVDLMRSMVERLDQQNVNAKTLSDRLGDMPQMVQGLQKTLAQVAATDERTASTLDEFKDNMARIQSAMGDMVDQTGKQAAAASKLADGSSANEQRHASVMQSLERAQKAQASKIDELVSGSQRSSMLTVGLQAIAVVALVAIAVMLATR